MKLTIEVNGEPVTVTLTKEQVDEVKSSGQTDPYLLACEKLGEMPRPTLVGCTTRRLIGEDFSHRLEVCIDAKNAIKQPDGTYKIWDPLYNGKENVYRPYFKREFAGSGWAYYDYYVFWGTATDAGPRREYKSHELMMEGVEEFIEYYNGVFNS